MTPALSIVLPVYNRAPLLRHPLDSLRAAAAESPDLAWELIIVDDASTEDIDGVLARYRDLPLRLHRLRENSGLLAARLAGLQQAQGDAVCFLDGDDAFAPGKFSRQLAVLAGHDVVYGDTARRVIDADGNPAGALRFDPPAGGCSDPAEFYLNVQPAPHNPIFRRQYLAAALDRGLLPPSRHYDPIAETWFYYQLSVRPARIAYAPGAWTIVGEPAGPRLSRGWERQAAAALRLMSAFLASCPATEATLEARRRVGLCAFCTWRALPSGFPPARSFLEVWRSAPPSPARDLGGRWFSRAARWLGPVLTGTLYRWCRRPAYRRIRTVSDRELATLFP